MDPKTYKFDTLSLHAGYQPEKNAGSRQVPIYQTTSYLFDDVDHAAALFNLIAIYVHGTSYNQIYVGEIILGTLPTLLALTIIYKKKSI